MEVPLDDLYLEWLYSQVASTQLRSPSKTYWSLFRQLFTKEFVWIVPNDDNRVEDGRDLRREFLSVTGIRNVDPNWIDLGCSVLEMLISLSRRCEFLTEATAQEWFWRLMDNLDLTRFNDSWYRKEHNEALIDERLNRLIFRNYYYDGSFGGLFPLKNPDRDQRNVEIWYQMNSYLLEQL
jgi:hypothetical protein